MTTPLMTPSDVSRETRERLDVYLDLLQRWNATHNLVSRAAPGDLWRRHVLDSLQLVPLAPPAATRWLDLGSGAGFPGLVVAIAAPERRTDTVVDLVESSHRKVAFLRAAIAATKAPARVHAVRVENVLDDWQTPVDIVTSRALAPLDQLLAWCGHLIGGDSRALFHKGASFRDEIAAARRRWRFDVIAHASLTDPSARILDITGVSPHRTATP
jgi:16S rRNA (guanine527-N7)-methyltransferase